MDPVQSVRCVQRLRISNFSSEPVTLCLEPWANEVSMLPEANFELVAEGPEGDYLQVAYEQRRITVYGWSGSVLSVFHDGRLVVACNIPVPRTPPRLPGTGVI
jgi:hypothetical protein